MSLYAAGFTLADQLIDEAAGRARITLEHPSFFRPGSLTMHAKVDDTGCIDLTGIGYTPDGYCESSGQVVASHKGKRIDRDGREWEVTILHVVGPLARYAHLLDTEDEGAAA